MAETPTPHRRDAFAENKVGAAFAKLSGSFPSLASLQGNVHFKYAVRNGVILIETKRDGRYWYWILVGEEFLLIGAFATGKLKRMKTITDETFTPLPHVA